MHKKELVIGCKAPVAVLVGKEKTHRLAEIVAIRQNSIGNPEYYVHYVGFNKRLDEWIPETRIDCKDPSKIEYPRKKKYVSKKEEAEALQAPTHSKTALTTEDIYKVKNIETIEMGEYTLNAWYFSPYPHTLAENKHIILCEYCLFYFSTPEHLTQHRQTCRLNRPPGAQIYRKDGIAFFELDGQIHVNYARNLSLLSKLFLDHKTLYYDIDVFFFYVMCIYNPADSEEDRQYKLVGYFSKEKESQHGYNVACVLILPQYQRKGYGRLLIDFSYLLSKRERVAASPEKPLSDLGLLSYRQYWAEKVTEILQHSKSISINDIRDMSSITTEDILHTLQTHKMLMFYNGVPAFILRDEALQKLAKSQNAPRLDPDYLLWGPSYLT
ncbi:histone acetyltransferase HTATIP [Nematocida homosporus]|uniref:histone acetyltransferase HTATIP n=1 Tax=Nematocida homosporus TaxID=1912981 RepID=UPI00221E6691|nr:histone acetyltransferase HTATIP [Nematocida homosporus]KAI5184392.1 histone acetyltransferase HTATIP [Nematocida homosporus]